VVANETAPFCVSADGRIRCGELKPLPFREAS